MQLGCIHIFPCSSRHARFVTNRGEDRNIFHFSRLKLKTAKIQLFAISAIRCCRRKNSLGQTILNRAGRIPLRRLGAPDLRDPGEAVPAWGGLYATHLCLRVSVDMRKCFHRSAGWVESIHADGRAVVVHTTTDGRALSFLNAETPKLVCQSSCFVSRTRDQGMSTGDR
jgi:hypothetical protein